MDKITELKFGILIACFICFAGIGCYFYTVFVKSIEDGDNLQIHCTIINTSLCLLMIFACFFLCANYYEYRQQIPEHTRLNIVLVIAFLLIVVFSVASIELLDPHTVTVSKVHWVTAFVGCILVVLFLSHLQFVLSVNILLAPPSLSTTTTKTYKIQTQKNLSILNPSIVPHTDPLIVIPTTNTTITTTTSPEKTVNITKTPNASSPKTVKNKSFVDALSGLK